MPLSGCHVPENSLYVERGEGFVSFDDAVQMKLAEISGPAPEAGRRYLIDLRGCEFALGDLKRWAEWNRQNTPPEHLGRAAYLVDEARATALLLLLRNEFAKTREAEVFSTVDAALDYLEANVSRGTLTGLGIST